MKAQCSLRKVKTFAVQFIWEFIGSVFIAAGIYNFAVQAKFPMTGFSGISIILYRLLNVPIGLSTILLNIPLAIICYRLLGKKFFVSSLRCMILSSIMIDYVAPLFPVYTGDRLLAALCTGVFGGIGYALIYSKNSSTGGSDFIIMAVKAIKPTILKGQGGYNGEEKQVVMCACSNKEMFHVQQAVKKADPASFLIVLESNEVHGEGFKMVQIGEEAYE